MEARRPVSPFLPPYPSATGGKQCDREQNYNEFAARPLHPQIPLISASAKQRHLTPIAGTRHQQAEPDTGSEGHTVPFLGCWDPPIVTSLQASPRNSFPTALPAAAHRVSATSLLSPLRAITAGRGLRAVSDILQIRSARQAIAKRQD